MIRQKAIDHGFACWDLFEIYGGKGSSKKWFSDKMMSNDRIHFNRDGYIYQGDMFYEALIRKYKENYSNNNN